MLFFLLTKPVLYDRGSYMSYVPPVYPTVIPSTSDLPDKTDDVDYYQAADINNIKKELRAALIELGISPKGAYADVAAAIAAALKIASPVAGDTVYYNGSAWVALPKGSDGQVLTLASGVPTWATAGGGSIPSGLIAMWHGLIANIPSGWVICDGNNETPNLLGKFVRSVPTAATNPGTTGGNDSLSIAEANLPSHQHTIAGEAAHTHPINSDGGHTHTINANADLEQSTDGAATAVNSFGSLTTSNNGAHTHGGNTGAGSSHNHGGNTGAVGSGTALDNRPAYYEVAFIMKT